MKTPEMLLGMAALITALGGPALVDAVTGRSERAEASDRKRELETQVQTAKGGSARRRIYDQVLACRNDLDETRAMVNDLRVDVAVLQAQANSFGIRPDPRPPAFEAPTPVAISRGAPSYEELEVGAIADVQAQMAIDIDEIESLEEKLAEE